MNLARAASIDDLRLMAKRRLPRLAFDFIDGGAESEHNLGKNRQAFDAVELLPRYLVDVSAPDTEVTLFSRSYAVPFGMAPVGFLNMAWPGADLMIARLAAEKRMPYAVSTASSTALEEIAEAADGHGWFQMYVTRDENLGNQLLERARAAGYEVLIVTVDVAQSGKRDRDIRNGLQIPLKLTPGILADLACHPRWSLGTLRAGAPGFGNFAAGRTGNTTSMSLTEIQERLISRDFEWDDLRRLRDRWQGPLLLKGVLHRDDALLAMDAGCDGLVISNHGGRQLDYGPASLSVLPSIAEAVGDRLLLMLDSGVRRGADAVRAKALGASFVLAGRAFAYGAAAGGEPGCYRAFELLEMELRRTLGQIGQPRFAAVDRTILAVPPPRRDTPTPSGAPA